MWLLHVFLPSSSSYRSGSRLLLHFSKRPGDLSSGSKSLEPEDKTNRLTIYSGEKKGILYASESSELRAYSYIICVLIYNSVTCVLVVRPNKV